MIACKMLGFTGSNGACSQIVYVYPAISFLLVLCLTGLCATELEDKAFGDQTQVSGLGLGEIEGESELPEEKKLTALVDWLRANGVANVGTPDSCLEADVQRETRAWSNSHSTSAEDLDRSSMELQPRADIGIKAKRNIKSGDVLMTIPNHLLISAEKMISEGLAPFDDSLDRDHPWFGHMTLAAWILREKGKGLDSFWAPYISLLPAYVPLPIFFDPELLKEFEHERLIVDPQIQAQSLETMYSRCLPDRIANASLKDFQWAMAMAWSRGFASSEQGVDRKSNVLLTPFADFLNHRNDYHAAWKFSSDSMIFYAIKDAQQGEEIFTSYGDKKSDEFVFSYGHTLEDNIFDSVVLFHDISEITSYYIANFSHFDFADIDVEWADYVATEAIKFVDMLIEEISVSDEAIAKQRTGMHYDEKYGFGAWSEGRVEPRLVAAIAAIWHYDVYRAEPKYDKVAELAIPYGLNVRNISCAWMNRHPQELSYGIEAALGTIYERVELILSGLSTSYEEDTELLAGLSACQYFKSNNVPDEFAYCNEISWQEYKNNEVVIKFRIEKKSLLHGVSTRLLESCPSPSGETEPLIEDTETSESQDQDEDEEGHDEL